MTARPHLLATSLLIALVVALPCAAQEATPEVRAAARQQFESGVSAAHEGRWDEAREAFRLSYELFPHHSTLLNLAGSEAETGRLVEAAETYRRFLREAPADDARRALASTTLSALEARIPQLRVLGAQAGASELRVDGRAMPVRVLDAALPLDPGAHVLRVESPDGARCGSVELTEGDRREVTLEPCEDGVVLAPEAPEEPVATEVAVAEEEVAQALVAEPPALTPSGDGDLWLWVGVSAAVLAVGAVATALAIHFGTQCMPAGSLGCTDLP